MVTETRRQVTDFYGDLVQGLMLPRTKAPKIREDDERDAAASPEASVLTPERPEGGARNTRRPSRV